MHSLTFCILFIFLRVVSSNFDNDGQASPQTSTSTTSRKTPTPYRYNRFIFFFLSENVTLTFLKDSIFAKLIEFDNYCGGENFRIVLLFGSKMEDDWKKECKICTLENYLKTIKVTVDLEASYAKNISAGSIDHNDVNNVSATLMHYVSAIEHYSLALITTQVILITDYVTDSLNSTDTVNFLLALKSLKIKLIALTSNITNERVSKYFPSNIWTVASNYTSWSPANTTANPICGYNAQTYTTPSKPYNSDQGPVIMAFLYLSYDYVNRTNLNEVIDLLMRLNQRRWSYPCSQYRYMKFQLVLPKKPFITVPPACYLEEANYFPPLLNTSICSAAFFNEAVKANDWRSNFETQDCTQAHQFFFLQLTEALTKIPNDKFLMITDVPQLCNNQSYDSIYTALEKYGDFSNGAPLTVIAIEKENDHNVSSSYAPLFPARQQPNLYAVNDIVEIISKVKKTINFCLNSVPWLNLVPSLNLIRQATLPYRGNGNAAVTLWYYFIGAAILVALLAVFLFLIMKNNRKRRKQMRHLGNILAKAMRTTDTTQNQLQHKTKPKRRERMRQMRDRKELVIITNNIAQNQFVNKSHQMVQDDWEISLEYLDIDFITVLGKGAFAVVHKGFLRGKAPVLNIFPSIALQHLKDCYVAVKISPQHSSERDKTKFRSEIELMKNIGYHIHLISMLGCNCSIERPILLMELAKQDLLHWLSSVTVDPNLQKTLLSIAWQVSDGMSYLSSKNFVHRDLAARNVLLNSEMKAMVSDFGLCKKIENSNQVLVIPDGMLPLKWMAFESLSKHEFSLKTDIWSFGILLFEIFNLGQELYMNVSDEDLVTYLREGNRLKHPRFADKQTYGLMKTCWQVDPAQRPDFFIIQSHFAEMLKGKVAKYGYLDATEDK